MEWLIILIGFTLVFDILNGFNDSADIAATIISSRSMSATKALSIAAAASFAGPFIFGVAVANTIGKNIVVHEFITMQVLLAAIISACSWSFFTWASGIPSSSSHALIGGLIGAALVGSSIKALITKGIVTVMIALMVSPLAGIFLGWLTMKCFYAMLKNATPRANLIFKMGQIPTAIALAAGNGANDSQKTMGLVTLGLVTSGYQQHFFVPLWVILICAGAKSLGTLIGGWRTIRVIGTRFYKIKPLHSFTAQLVSATVIITSSLLGGPVSTTQIVSMAVIGAGAGERISKVRWLTLREIFLSWMITIPVTAILSMVIYYLVEVIFLK